jgi:enamine deaminase RidA (YjgF/YER057c/UK114 family)
MSSPSSFSRTNYPSPGNPLPGVWDSSSFGFSQAVTVSGPSRRIYLAGQAAMNEKGEVVFPGDKFKQFEFCLQNVKKVLEGLGASVNDIVQCNTMMADYDAERDLKSFMDVWNRNMNNRIATSLYCVPTLAIPGSLVEVDVIAEAPL